ncbi:unnamed protein product [Durusdinium trenchii]|uniref:Microbial-type PARG catalytic domain-containing protein n=1 Tax=Durusdinium trenchii TaxID=1381693 RepID=A0ABP0SM52_9DINO
MALEDKRGHSLGKLLVVGADAFREDFAALRHPTEMKFDLGGQRFTVYAMVWSDWLYSFSPPETLLSRWETAKAALCQSVKQEVFGEAKNGERDAADLKLQLETLLSRRGLQPDSDHLLEFIHAAVKELQGELQWKRLDEECLRICKQLADDCQVPWNGCELPSQARQQFDRGCSDDYALKLCIRRVADDIMAAVVKADEGQLKSILALEVSFNETLRYFQEQVKATAEKRLNQLHVKSKFKLLAELFDLAEEDKQKFVDQAVQNGLDERALVDLLYQYRSRRFVPQIFLDELPDTDEAKFARGTVPRICELFGQLRECKIPMHLSNNFTQNAQNAVVISCREENGHYLFLLHQAEHVVLQLLRTMPVGCEIVQQLPVFLRTLSLPTSEAYRKLDQFRVLGLHVRDIRQVKEYVEIEITLWHELLHKLHLPEFQIRHMKLVSKCCSGLEEGAFPVSLRETVFYAESFEHDLVKLPGGFAEHAVPLLPNLYAPPPTIPSGSDVTFLSACFSHLNNVDLETLRGKTWSPEGCKELFALCQGIRNDEHSIRVMVMAHTRIICESNRYTFNGNTVELPPPTSYVSTGRSDSGPRLKSTELTVTNLDTLTAAEKTRQAFKHGRILVLNMANRHSPGGGYRKGSRAQEEDLFRRTTLSNGLVQEYGASVSYPMEEFAPIISCDVLAFRGSEQEGYPLRPDPVRIDVLSVAAYNGSRRGGQEESFHVLEKGGDVFSEEGFVRTLRNIAGLLEAAAVHGADHLILGALGCGAFGNNPKQVAGIFKTLLPAFAGHFKTVDFAILEGGDGDSNYSVFRSVLLDGAQKVHLQSVSKSGFRKMLTCQKLCPKLGRCEDVSSESHLQEFWHPDMCPKADCAEAGDHCALWRHQQFCPEQNCKVVFGPKRTRTYNRHCELYKHRKLCSLENCQDSSHTHPPSCPHGVRCRYKGQNHPDGIFYSHRMRPCPDGTVCSKWNDADHRMSFSHVFNPPCRDPMHCELLSQGRTEDPHFHASSHLCPFGSSCRKIGDSEHQKGWIHLDRPSCPEGAACARDKQIHFEDHLQLFQHPNVKLIRDPCRRGRACRQLGCRDHRSSYKHDDADGVLCAAGVWGHNTSRNLMEENQASYEVHFHQNAKNLIKKINGYFKSEANKEELSATAEFWRRCRVVHRLPYTSFSRVLKTGFVASQHCLQTHALDPEIACHLPSVQDLVQDPAKGRSDAGVPNLQEFVDAFLRRDQVQRESQLFQAPRVQVQVAQNALGGFHARQQQAELHLQHSRARAARVLGKRAIDRVEADLVNYSSAMKELKLASEQAAQKGQNVLSGIGHEYDRVVETNKMVFGILGIHTLNYGEDKDGDEHDQGVHLIFKPESLHHPDVFVTPMAATFYNSGRGDDERPWWKKGKPSAPFEAMAWEKLHPSSPVFHEALATEFLARAAHKGGGDLARVKFTDVKDYIKGTNAHFSAECHLPYVTPLGLG